ncbi:MAG: uroporphyrinogen decarboxylase family protein [Planctomycetota bacterium]
MPTPDLRTCLPMDARQLARFEGVYARYKRLWTDPDRAVPPIIIDIPTAGQPTMEAQLADPLVMLRAQLETLKNHIAVEDDCVPTVRVSFGTAQVAAAFGCAFHFPPDSLPAAAGPVMTAAADVHRLPRPALDAAWFGKTAEWTRIWKQHLPAGVHIQHPDIQSAFNSAHLIRGNDILLDFYDSPAELDLLLDRVTDYMIDLTRHLKAMISDDREWFFDWLCLWKGTARISNCTMQLISPQQYREHVLPRAARFFAAVGGGRMHYYGLTADVIEDFFKVPGLHGLDIDCKVQDYFAICDRAPKHLVLFPTVGFAPGTREYKRLLAGDWPRKRNIVIMVKAKDVAEGRELLTTLRAVMPWRD